jgi:hypothetical protein
MPRATISVETCFLIIRVTKFGFLGYFSSKLMKREGEIRDYRPNTISGMQGGDSPISKWHIHLLKGLVQTSVSAHLQRFGEWQL